MGIQVARTSKMGSLLFWALYCSGVFNVQVLQYIKESRCPDLGFDVLGSLIYRLSRTSNLDSFVVQVTLTLPTLLPQRSRAVAPLGHTPLIRQ